jgi:hypothetical protein
MARTVKLAPTEKSAPKAKQVVAPSRLSGIRNNLPTIFGALALVAAGALAGTALAHGGFDGRDGRHPGPGMEARMDDNGEHNGGGMGGPGGDRDGDGQQGAGERQGGPEFVGTVVSASPTELSITLADGTSQTVSLDAASQYFAQTTGTVADITVGSYVLVEEALPVGNTAPEVTGVAVLANGLTDAHVHLGRPAKVTAVNGSELTLEALTPRGAQTIKVTIGANTSVSKIATATNADLTAGSNVVIDLGPNMPAAKSVLIVK